MEERFIFTQRAKMVSIGLMVIGVIALLVGIMTAGGHGEDGHGGLYTRVWANIWQNNIFFVAIALGGGFFISFNYLANAGWFVLVKRVPEAMTTFIPYILPLMLIVFIFGGHDLFHWTHEELYDVNNKETYDSIIAGKRGYLNPPFFLIRMVVYFVLWTFLTYMLRKLSLREDIEGGTNLFRKRVMYSAFFIVVFAITTSTAAWDWLMSIDTHWISTLLGWYLFASLFVSGMAAITLLVIYLKKQGYLSQVNDEHLHDLGKFIFAFSVFWTYLWFCQFMLIWYANIPEETIYFHERLTDFRVLFFVNFGINFFLPFFILMTRNAKRRMSILVGVSIMVLIGHWLDFFLMIMPGSVGSSAHIGYLEVGITLGYLGLFIFIVLNTLTKASLVPKKHPYLEESIHHFT